ncbi:hypothetical protein Pmani_008990 [Petrolisthes manimaculis]|uniref:Uncharacterized protein n=1 Tax=Petrolisthes manimaculis TaxID=1843537 RepID=A0AAE1UE17_9EUCA|nr:hypothetical protein Pmani_008990 [Petrolisthes manimaculis]
MVALVAGATLGISRGIIAVIARDWRKNSLGQHRSHAAGAGHKRGTTERSDRTSLFTGSQRTEVTEVVRRSDSRLRTSEPK